MSPTAIPSRITIDFRDAAMPSRTWILGVDEAATDRLELIAFEAGPPTTERAPTLGAIRPAPPRPAPPVLPTAEPVAVLADCACPEFCERDHANE